MSAARIVVTGVGSVGPWGIGLDGLEQALAAGKPLARAIDGRQGYHVSHSARLAALCPDTELREILPGRQARRLGPASRLAVAAAKLASASAELTATELEAAGVVLTRRPARRRSHSAAVAPTSSSVSARRDRSSRCTERRPRSAPDARRRPWLVPSTR
jgi:3-oxoacyl-(acyl-carrier-protein) synthase